MKFPLITLSALALISLFAWQGCYYDNEEFLYGPPPPIPACDTLSVSYQNDVAGIIQNRGCLGCHNNSILSGNVNLEGYDNVRIQALNGKLLGSISHAPGFKEMPQGLPKIPDVEIKLIECWIEQGTLNN